MRDTPGTARELLRIALGKSQVAPDKGDKRFADPAWQEHLLYRRALQAYLYLGSRVDPYVDSLGIEGVNRERARFALMLAREAMAPTNFLMTNPAALKRSYDTAGGSVLRGMANMAGDLRHNHGMPSMVDRRPFKIGENHRGHARRGHLPDRGVRAHPVHAAKRHRLPAPHTDRARRR